MSDVDYVKAAPGSLLHFTWGRGNQLHICGVGNPDRGVGEQNPCLTTAQWGVPNEAHERVTMDLCPKFRIFQQHVQGDRRDLSAPAELFYKEVSDILQANQPRSPEKWMEVTDDEYYVQLDSAAWHLLEGLLIKAPTRDGYIAEVMVSWLRDHGSTICGAREGVYISPAHAAEQLLQLAEVGVSASEQPAYWPTLCRLVAVGEVEAAHDLLHAHSAATLPDLKAASAAARSEHTAIIQMMGLLRTFPRFAAPSSLHSYTDIGKFTQVRQAWLRAGGIPETERSLRPHLTLIRSSSPATAEGVGQLMSVLRGDAVVLQEMTDNWLELLVAVLLHLYPTMQLQPGLVDLMGKCDEAKGKLPDKYRSTLVTDIIKACAEMEIQRIVEIVTSSSLMTTWMACHVFDILAACPAASLIVHAPLPHLGISQSEVYRLEYAMSLMLAPTSWRAAAEYLCWCERHGLAGLQELFIKMPTHADDRLLHKVLHTCSEHSLTATKAILCRIKAVSKWLGGSTAQALQWATRSGDDRLCTIITAPLVEHGLQQLAPADTSSYSLRGGADVDGGEVSELEGLLESVSGGEDRGFEQGGRRPTGVELLQGIVKLRQALAAVKALEEKAERSQGALQQAASTACSSALDLILCEPPSPSLQRSVLSAIIPLLEGPYRAVSLPDVMKLQNAILRTTFLQPTFQRSQLHDRRVQDGLLALTRSVAKAVVCDGS